VPRTRIRQGTQSHESQTFDDSLAAGSTLETLSDSVEFDFNALRSQLKRIIDLTGDWFDAPAIDLAGLNTAFLSHASRHEDGGADEIDVTGLSGVLADAQLAQTHALGGAVHSSATLAELNALISDATLDDQSSPRLPLAHMLSHLSGGSDELDGDKLDIDYLPTNYTRDATPAEVTLLAELTSHLAGIDTALASGLVPGLHASTHEDGGADEISVTDLSGLLADPQTPLSHSGTHENGGVDEIDLTGLSGLLADQQDPINHAVRHLRGGVDEIAADQLDIDYLPANYTRTVVLPATHVEHLTAHLKGIDDRFLITAAHGATHQNGGSDEFSLAGMSGLLADAQTPLAHVSTHENGGSDELNVGGLSGLLSDQQNPLAHAASHVRTGLDEIDGDKLDIDYVPTNYTRTTTPPQVTNVEELTAHLAGIDAAIVGAGVPAHAATHENGGVDEISVAGLSGLLADPQTPLGHGSSHDDGGSDELTAQDLGSAAAVSGRIMETDGAGGWNLIVTPTGNPLSGATPVTVTPGAGSAGVGTDVSRDDHDHELGAHASTHENGGADEISVAGLSGVLADPQTPASHASTHENGGADEISVAGLSGLLADPQTPTLHASSHEDGGADEIDVTNLSGLLADPQTPTTHASTHVRGGSDEMDGDVLDIDYAPTNYTRTTTPPQVTNVEELTAHLAGIDSALASVGGWSGAQVFYVGKHGSNPDNGLSYAKAKLTFTNAIAAASALTPSTTNRFVIVCEDAGIYAESFTVPSWVSVYAPNVRIEGTITLQDDSNVIVNEVFQSAGIAVLKSTGTGTSRFEAQRVHVTGTAIAAINAGVNSVLIYEVKTTHIQNGFGIGDVSTADGHIHLQCEDIYIEGTGTAISRFAAGTTEGYVAHILEVGAGIGNGTGINVSGGSVDLLMNRLVANTVYNVIASAALNLHITSAPVGAVGAGTGSKNVLPTLHVANHENGGIDEISVAGLSGLLADAQTPTSHASSHQNGGADEISVAGLSGLLADPQTPTTHASTHVRGGSDEMDGDVLDIDFTPSNYTPDVTPPEVTNVDELSAHLAGIDNKLGEPTMVNISDTAVAEGNNSITGSEDQILVKRIRVETSAVNWTLTVYSRDDYTSDPLAIFENRIGDWELEIDIPYEDKDASQEFHYNFNDLNGSNTHDIELWAVKL
jgi:hypothetical protein